MLVIIIITPTTRLRVLASDLFAICAAILAHRRVNMAQSIRQVISGVPPIAKWLMPPVSAVKVIMKTLVPTAMCI